MLCSCMYFSSSNNNHHTWSPSIHKSNVVLVQTNVNNKSIDISYMPPSCKKSLSLISFPSSPFTPVRVPEGCSGYSVRVPCLQVQRLEYNKSQAMSGLVVNMSKWMIQLIIKWMDEWMISAFLLSIFLVYLQFFLTFLVPLFRVV